MKDGDESVVTISYKIKFVDSAIFLASSLSNCVDNLAEVIHKTTCKHCDRISWTWKGQGQFDKIYMLIL